MCTSKLIDNKVNLILLDSVYNTTKSQNVPVVGRPSSCRTSNAFCLLRLLLCLHWRFISSRADFRPGSDVSEAPYGASLQRKYSSSLASSSLVCLVLKSFKSVCLVHSPAAVGLQRGSVKHLLYASGSPAHPLRRVKHVCEARVPRIEPCNLDD